ncbi:MAG: hypothetical protein K6G50_04375 [bacterium]|nr:hypothetical protein [bacterium]
MTSAFSSSAPDLPERIFSIFLLRSLTSLKKRAIKNAINTQKEGSYSISESKEIEGTKKLMHITKTSSTPTSISS